MEVRTCETAHGNTSIALVYLRPVRIRWVARLPPMPEPSSARTSATPNLAVIGGDGIGPEVVAEGLKVLDAATAPSGLKVSTTEYDLGAPPLARHRRDPARQRPGGAEGARRDPARRHRRPGRPQRGPRAGLLLPIRFALEHYVNLRPAKLYPGVAARSTWPRRPRRHRLRRRPGGHRGPLRRQRRLPADRHPQ